MASDKLQEKTDGLENITNDEAKKSLSAGVEEFMYVWRKPFIFLVIGLILVGLGVVYYRVSQTDSSSSIEVLESTTVDKNMGFDIVVEISGEVEKPGVYKLTSDSRVEDLLIACGGISVNADREWIEKYINRAAKLSDGQKVYIPSVSEQSDTVSANNSRGIKVDQAVLGSGSRNLVNINSATLSELDTLPGIGQVYAQSIVEHRPYSNIEELVSKSVLKQNVYEKVKDRITIY